VRVLRRSLVAPRDRARPWPIPINAANTDDGASAPRASKQRTRAAARVEAEAEEARKRGDAESAANVAQLLDPKPPNVGAAQVAVAPRRSRSTSDRSK
jgi:hypothetical protein